MASNTERILGLEQETEEKKENFYMKYRKQHDLFSTHFCYILDQQ